MVSPPRTTGALLERTAASFGEGSAFAPRSSVKARTAAKNREQAILFIGTSGRIRASGMSQAFNIMTNDEGAAIE